MPARAVPVQVQGHRGAGLLKEENTLRAFRHAIQEGYDSVEMDLWMTKDGRAVVIHGGLPSIPDPDTVTLSELRRDIADQDIQAPLLIDVLTLLSQGGMHVQLELKGPLTDPNAILNAVESTYGDRKTELVQYSGFDAPKLMQMKELAPTVTRSLTFDKPLPEDWLEQAQKIGASYVDFRYSTVTSEIVKKAHDHGIRVMAWFNGNHNDTEAELRTLMEQGVDRICCNRPDLLQQILAADQA